MEQDDLEKGRASSNGSSRRTAALWAFLSRSLHSRGVPEARARDLKQEKKPMSDGPIPKQFQKRNYTHAENEEACAKLWNVYVVEAERYDRGLVASWKGDMNGMLIFSGLFSASLTAFLIESYKTLQPDSGDTSVVLLSQILQHIAPTSPVGAAPIANIPAPFQATTAAMICNVLWFMSLALSLTCALLATLVEHWAREFLHKTEIRPAPIRRARVFSFLYLGLKQFHMHTVVDIIPVLLHFSLLFFFAGLVAFLLPINVVLMYLMGAVLAVFSTLYLVLTVLPVIYRACPYRTPLSAGLWRLRRYYGHFFSTSQAGHSMTEAMSEEALENSEERDRHAVQWTVASLTDDNELLPFVEAIPDAIHGPKGFHDVNDHLFLRVLDIRDPQLCISTRLVNLIRSSESLLLDDALRNRRRVASLKAIWALGMSNAKMPDSTTRFERNTLDVLSAKTLDDHYSLSAYAAVRFSRWNTFKCCVNDIAVTLRSAGFSPSSATQRQTLDTIRASMEGLTLGDIPGSEYFHADSFVGHFLTLKNPPRVVSTAPGTESGIATSLDMTPMKEAAENLVMHRHWTVARVEILADFLFASLKIENCPHEFLATCNEILPDFSAIAPIGLPHVHTLFKRIPNPSQIKTMTSELHGVDKIVMMSLKLLSFSPKSFFSWDSGPLSALYRYIANRDSNAAILYILSGCDIPLLGSYIIGNLSLNSFSDDGIKCIWILLFHGHRLWQETDLRDWAQQLFPALSPRPFSTSMAILSSYIILDLKDVLAEIQQKLSQASMSARGELDKIRNHPLFLAYHPGIILPNKSTHEACTLLFDRLMEIRLAVLSQLLSNYAIDAAPYKGAETAKLLLSDVSMRLYKGQIRPKYQRSFADSVNIGMQCLRSNPGDSELLQVTTYFWHYSLRWGLGWIDDVASASTLIQAVDLYLSSDDVEDSQDNPVSPAGRARHLRDHCRQILAAAPALDASDSPSSSMGSDDDVATAPSNSHDTSTPANPGMEIQTVPLDSRPPSASNSDDEFTITIELVE